jgi:quercetin dioxygenase-like cupin family protein
MTVQLGEITPGHQPGPHSHPYEQLVIIWQGECDFYVDGVPYPMSAGCLMTIPPNIEHYIVAKGDVPVLNMDIFHPKRPDRTESVENSKQ